MHTALLDQKGLVRVQAENLGVQLASERIIYNLMNRVSLWASELLPKVEQENVTGQAEVLQVWPHIQMCQDQ